MSYRTTKEDVQNLIDRLNEIKGFKDSPYGTVGMYRYDGAYGGCRLVQFVNDGGAIEVISAGGFVSKRELADQIYTALKLI